VRAGGSRRDETERAIKDAGEDVAIVRADVTKMDDLKCLVDTAWDKFGAADNLVNNAAMEEKSAF
jgi:glucose 1-dehydrogenase